MTTSESASPFTNPAAVERLERAAAALAEHGFTVEILDDAAARARVKDLIPEGASVFTGASETLRLSGIEEDINTSGRYDSVKSRPPLDRATQRTEIWAALSTPDFIAGSVAAVTETGSLVVASASGGQIPGYAGAAARAISVVGAQKVVPDLPSALRRIEEHCLPLESDRAMTAYGRPSAINRVLILNAEPNQGAALSCCSAKPSDSETSRAPQQPLGLPAEGSPRHSACSATGPASAKGSLP